jgi:sugar lactone lactonase YvrE
MSGFTPEQKGRAALAAFSLVTGELLRVIDVPSDGRDHVLGDLVVAPDGTIYATDSTAPIIWRYLPGGEEMDKLVEYPDFVSLQGLVLTNRTLIAADFANGLFAIDLSESAPVVRAFTPPPNATLVGLDGLAPAPDGLFAVQTGVSPQRLIRVGLSSDLTALTSVTVLAAAFPHLDDLALVTLVNGRPTFIANAGWENFDAAKSAHPPAHSVRIFQTTPP